MILNRDAILAIDDLPREEVQIPEWKGSVFVRALTGGERDQLERMTTTDMSRAKMVALCAVDENGQRLFSEKDVEHLTAKNGRALEKIVHAAMRFNAISDEGIKDAGNV